MDADHLAAVSAIVSQQRSVGRSCLLGVFWGAGHAASLLLAGLAVLAFKLTISSELEQTLERLVACVLLVLGGHVLLKAIGVLLAERGDPAGDGEVRPGVPHHAHVLRWGGRPFLVGVLHGLAGSAALSFLALTTMGSAAAGLLYIAVFGVGATIGMLVLSGLIGIPFALTAGRSLRLLGAVQMVAGAASMVLGAVLVGGTAG
jgi:high-affinity nickel-transport protein